MTLTYKILSQLYLRNRKVKEVNTWLKIVRGVGVQWSDLNLTYDHARVALSLEILSGLYLGNIKV